ncbi:MAG: alkaline phosphatase family protein [Pyrinomonadaceae bacterium]
MSRPNGGRVLAIGLDAREPALIRRMIAQDEMPTLRSLLAEGRWMRVQSPAHIGSGSVWPTFMTGKEPSAHGVYGPARPDGFCILRAQSDLYEGGELPAKDLHLLITGLLGLPAAA